MASLVFPFHDPNNIETKYLQKILPILKANFKSAFVSVTPKTIQANPEAVNFLNSDKFFVVNRNPTDSLVGDHFLSAYRNAAVNSNPDEILHLCTSDRLAFILLSNFRDIFLADIKKPTLPLLFIRSKKAWATHPRNYQAVESMVTEVGKVLFGKSLDFAWCHLAISVKQLKPILPELTAHDLVICAQLIMNLKNIRTKPVDWLSWEDPFIFEKDPKTFKLERERDPKEFEKRMSYVLPEVSYLLSRFQS